MSTYYGIVLAITAGFFIVLQLSINNTLSRYIGNLPTAFTTHIVGAVVAMVIIGVQLWYSPAMANSLQQWRTAPWYAYTGGALGVIVVTVALYAVQLLPMATMFAVVTVSQLVLGSCIDHYGLFGMPKVAINAQKIFGILALGLGVYLLKK